MTTNRKLVRPKQISWTPRRIHESGYKKISTLSLFIVEMYILFTVYRLFWILPLRLDPLLNRRIQQLSDLFLTFFSKLVVVVNIVLGVVVVRLLRLVHIHGTNPKQICT